MEEEGDGEGDQGKERYCEKLKKVSVSCVHRLRRIDIRLETSKESYSCHA